MIRRWHPEILWSTAPIATAHWIGLTLHRLTGLPWVADIRDLLTEPNEPAHPLAWRTTRWIERRTLLGSSRTVVVSPGQKNEYLNQFPNLQPSHLRVVPNGYDEEAFADAERTLAPARDQNRLLLIHGGVLYPDGRNPEAFFQALARLIGDGRIGSEELEVRLRASGSEDLYEPRIRKLGLESIVRLLPGLDYREGLAEMMSADGLLLFQGAGTGTAIPAKLYEYFRAQRPILALTEPGGATAAELEKAGFDRMAPLEDPDLILSVMESWIQDLRHGKGHTLSLQEAQGYSRQEGTAQLARIFEEISG
jgi:glycosyltransferase involved in cell wall biosynthesis